MHQSAGLSTDHTKCSSSSKASSFGNLILTAPHGSGDLHKSDLSTFGRMPVSHLHYLTLTPNIHRLALPAILGGGVVAPTHLDVTAEQTAEGRRLMRLRVGDAVDLTCCLEPQPLLLRSNAKLVTAELDTLSGELLRLGTLYFIRFTIYFILYTLCFALCTLYFV